jgi:hypothetical protein
LFLYQEFYAINVKENRRDNQEFENPETLATLGTQPTGWRQSRDTGNIGHTTQQDEDNPETLATLGTQPTGWRQSRDTGNIGHTTPQDEDNNKKYPAVWLIHIAKYDKSLVDGRGKKNLRKKEKIHCHLRYGYFITMSNAVVFE